MTTHESPKDVLKPPGASFGLVEVFRRHYLLSLIVGKEVGIRYRGSIFGWLWSYVKPLVQFLVFYFALGVFLGQNERVPDFALYLLSGITVVTFFNEAFANGTRSFLDNAALIKKIYFPRQMFPISSTLVAAVNTVPQIIVVAVIALIVGWRPGLGNIAAILLGLIIVALLATGLGMLFGSINVTFRDAQSFVDIIIMVSVWASPVMYQWTVVADKAPTWLFQLYTANPITIAVELFHYGLWTPIKNTGGHGPVLPDLWMHAGVATLIAALVLVIGEFVFRRLEGRFAQDL